MSDIRKEGNEVIGKYLGFTQGKAGETRWADHWFEAQVPNGNELECGARHRYLNFDWDWNWLMVAVDKFEELNFDILMRPTDCIISYNYNVGILAGLDDIHAVGENKKLALFNAIVCLIQKINSFECKDVHHQFKIGDLVDVPEPNIGDRHNFDFTGNITNIISGIATIVDGDDDYFDIELYRLTLSDIE